MISNGLNFFRNFGFTVSYVILFTGDAKLEYTALCFNHDKYLVGLSGVPDYLLTLWDWKEGKKLHSQPTSISVCRHILKNSYTLKNNFLISIYFEGTNQFKFWTKCRSQGT